MPASRLTLANTGLSAAEAQLPTFRTLCCGYAHISAGAPHTLLRIRAHISAGAPHTLLRIRAHISAGAPHTLLRTQYITVKKQTGTGRNPSRYSACLIFYSEDSHDCYPGSRECAAFSQFCRSARARIFSAAEAASIPPSPHSSSGFPCSTKASGREMLS